MPFDDATNQQLREAKAAKEAAEKEVARIREQAELERKNLIAQGQAEITGLRSQLQAAESGFKTQVEEKARLTAKANEEFEKLKVFEEAKAKAQLQAELKAIYERTEAE